MKPILIVLLVLSVLVTIVVAAVAVMVYILVTEKFLFDLGDGSPGQHSQETSGAVLPATKPMSVRARAPLPLHAKGPHQAPAGLLRSLRRQPGEMGGAVEIRVQVGDSLVHVMHCRITLLNVRPV